MRFNLCWIREARLHQTESEIGRDKLNGTDICKRYRIKWSVWVTLALTYCGHLLKWLRRGFPPYFLVPVFINDRTVCRRSIFFVKRVFGSFCSKDYELVFDLLSLAILVYSLYELKSNTNPERIFFQFQVWRLHVILSVPQLLQMCQITVHSSLLKYIFIVFLIYSIYCVSLFYVPQIFIRMILFAQELKTGHVIS